MANKNKSTSVTGVRLSGSIDAVLSQACLELIAEGYPEKEVNKSTVVRSLIDFYKDYAKVAFRKANPYLTLNKH